MADTRTLKLSLLADVNKFLAGMDKADKGGSNNASSTTIIMNGVIDGESARRSIERLMQDSSRRTGAVNLAGATL